MAPRCPETADSRRKAKPSLDVPEPELTAMLEQCCDLRRRGFSQNEIQGKLQLTRQQTRLLLAEAARREMPGSQENQSDAVAEWLLSCFDAGIEISAIPADVRPHGTGNKAAAQTGAGHRQRQPAFRPHHTSTGRNTRPRVLARPRRTAHAPTVRRRLSQPTTRPKRHWSSATRWSSRCSTTQTVPPETAPTPCCTSPRVECTPSTAKRVGNSTTPCTTPDSMTTPKRTVVLKLHDHPHVQLLLLQRCGISPRWLGRQTGQVPVSPDERVRLLASIHPLRGRTPGPRPRIRTI